jgi:hypothetical protein
MLCYRDLNARRLCSPITFVSSSDEVNDSVPRTIRDESGLDYGFRFESSFAIFLTVVWPLDMPLAQPFLGTPFLTI